MPQGNLLGPLLFVISANVLPDICDEYAESFLLND